MHLEAKLENSKYVLSGTLDTPDTMKSIQQDTYTLKPNMGPYLQENDTKINQQVEEPRNEISESVSEPTKMSSNESFQSQQYNISSNQNEAQNRANFITLEKISGQERVEIIETGFRLNQEGKISLKKYYESRDPDSLFQLKGYSIKYESIRCRPLLKQLKP